MINYKFYKQITKIFNKNKMINKDMQEQVFKVHKIKKKTNQCKYKKI